MSLRHRREDAGRRPSKIAHCGSQKLQKVASEAITPIPLGRVGVMGARPSLGAEPKLVTGVGDEPPKPMKRPGGGVMTPERNPHPSGREEVRNLSLVIFNYQKERLSCIFI
ncbi:hypothetical protein TBCH5v1_2683 [Thermococcus barophilus]|uniref:Uncharacterized protein n=1 Tax=Thermococcus barophilus TaxID=55802 RepID=A0A0S1XFN6_THEBA|nr:hypothetical protein TBCH5v1_2683 [Thermococcus barophilus]